MAARVGRGALVPCGIVAVAFVVLVSLLAAGCGGSSESSDNERAATRHPPTVNGVAAYVATSHGRTVVVTGALDDTSWRTHPVPGDPAPGRVRLAASADGRVIVISVFSEEMTSLHVLDVPEDSLRRLALPEDRVRILPAVSPDGARVALAGDTSLSIVATDGGPPTRLPTLHQPTSPSTYLGSVWLSPDGRSLLYELWHENPDDPRPYYTSVEFVLLALDQLQSRVVAEVAGPAEGHTSWSPDSRRLAIVGNPWNTDWIKIIAVRGVAKSEVTGLYPTDVVWTRRGMYTFAGDRDRLPSELVLVDPETGTQQPVAQQEGMIVATPSGDVVAVVDWPHVHVFSATGKRLLDRTLGGAPDAPYADGATILVLVDS